MKNNNMPRPVHFEIFADDPARAAKFYTDVFGWKIEKWDSPAADMDYWMVTTGDKENIGINGGLAKHSEPAVKGGANAFVCTMGVSNFDEYHEKILKAGGTVQTPKGEIPEMGWLGYYYDSEGNSFGIMEPFEKM
jgi:predicted enzyme related to lactoylglutathione lyase